MSDGAELRLFDPRRDPPDWTDCLRPTQCTVFLKDRKTSAALNPEGKPYPDHYRASCIVFNRLADAQEFCEAIILQYPHVRCEIYDAEGLAHSPLLTVGQQEDARPFRHSKVVAVLLFAVAPLLVWMDMRRANTLILPTFLACNCVLLALRFLYWDYGVRHQERERQKRLEAHIQKEGAAATRSTQAPS